METVFCPVLKNEINGTDCLIICDVADRLLKPTVLPKGIEWNDQQREKCKSCEYHADLA